MPASEVCQEERVGKDRKLNIEWLRSPRKESLKRGCRAEDCDQGRQQKRAALAAPLWLTSLEHAGKLDWAVTENVSERGARVITKMAWSEKEAVLISVPPGFSANARITYCHSLPSGNYVVGIDVGGSFPHWVRNLKGAA
jgi:hypothetical protein